MLKPFKSARTEKIVPAFLQQGIEHLAAHLCHIFRACLARRSIPKAWRQVKAMFITQPRMANYIEGKAYRHINLSPFMLKTTEKLVLCIHE